MLLEIKNYELLEKFIEIYIETGNEEIYQILKDIVILPEKSG